MTDQRTITLRAAGAALVLRVPDTGLPQVLHWGADLPDFEGLALAARPPAANNGVDVPTYVSLVPTQGEGWRGHPGLAGHHEGRITYPAWSKVEVDVDPLEDAEPTWATGHRLRRGRGFDSAPNCAWNPKDWSGPGTTVTNLDPAPLDPGPRTTSPPVAPRRPRRSWTRPAAGARTCPATLAVGNGNPHACLAPRPHRPRLPARAHRRHPGLRVSRGEVWGVHTAWSGDHVHLAEYACPRARARPTRSSSAVNSSTPARCAWGRASPTPPRGCS